MIKMISIRKSMEPQTMRMIRKICRVMIRLGPSWRLVRIWRRLGIIPSKRPWELIFLIWTSGLPRMIFLNIIPRKLRAFWMLFWLRRRVSLMGTDILLSRNLMLPRKLSSYRQKKFLEEKYSTMFKVSKTILWIRSLKIKWDHKFWIRMIFNLW